MTNHIQSKISVTLLNDMHDVVTTITLNDRTDKLNQTAATLLISMYHLNGRFLVKLVKLISVT